MDNLTPVIFGAALTFVFGLLGIIHNYLNKKTEDNKTAIKEINDRMVTIEVFDKYKTEHNREHDKQDRLIEKALEKLDEIYRFLLEGKHEK